MWNRRIHCNSDKILVANFYTQSWVGFCKRNNFASKLRMQVMLIAHFFTAHSLINKYKSTDIQPLM